MNTSRYFERTLFYDRSPAADEYYERSSELIFEKDTAKSRIEVRLQSFHDVPHHVKSKDNHTVARFERVEDGKQAGSKFPTDHVPATPFRDKDVILEAYDKDKAIKSEKDTHDNFDEDSDSEDTWSLSSRASSTALPIALDQHQGGSCPPLYPGPPQLELVDLKPADLKNFIQKTRHDFRVFYLRQRHSYSRLQITKELFEQLLKHCHVFPRFNEYLIGFGSRQSEAEVGPPPLKFRPLCSIDSNNYHGFECSYILRYVEFTNRPGKKPWSLRQFAIYHRYKPKPQNHCSTWILVGASQRTEVRLDRYTRSVDNLIEANPFELHVIFLDTAIASWRPYLVYLTQQVTYQSNKAIGIMIGNPDEEEFLSIEVEDHQELKQIEDEISDLIICLESTLDTVSTFDEMYSHFCLHQNENLSSHASSHQSAYGSDALTFALREKTKEIVYTRKKAEALLSKVQNSRTLISSLLERQSGHNIDQQISALRKLELQGHDENVIMRQLAEKNSRDSSSMRILTIITMVYLPCTIVSNFFSTQFVNQKVLGNGDTKLEYAQNSWLFFAISVPLTLFTILIWYLWVHFEKMFRCSSRQKKDHEKILNHRSRLQRLRKSFTGLPV